MSLQRLILDFAVFGGLMLAWLNALTMKRFVIGTTLIPAWRWGILSLFLWSIAILAQQLLENTRQISVDHVWHAAAVVSLCPLTAVLGSRKPGVRVWTFFIQIPLVLVLSWPIVSLWLQGTETRGLQLETPQVVAYFFVLIMGAGNYLGTALTLPSLLYMFACGSVVITSSQTVPIWMSDRAMVRSLATGVIVLSILSANACLKRLETHKQIDPSNQLWFDFLNTFGIVWGRRIQDRINAQGVKEGWPVRLDLSGFVWTIEAASRTDIQQRMEQTIRWLLRRFVEPEWIDRRLGHSESPRE
ncbi:MAG: hypothetical protein FJ267_05970 [Planctomycetes bacterium]|nr:hypothetical protein [Planctomycetota bacterium]